MGVNQNADANSNQLNYAKEKVFCNCSNDYERKQWKKFLARYNKGLIKFYPVKGWKHVRYISSSCNGIKETLDPPAEWWINY